MEALKQKIREQGTEIGTKIVKVDSFLNHQLDIALFMEIGKEVHKRCKDLNINKILTIEASGIGIASIVAMYFDCVPVVFAKKAKPNTMIENVYETPIKSFTKGVISTAHVAESYLNADDRILIVDDFLAHGEAAAGLARLVEMGGGEVCGVVAIIEKEFAGGGAKLRELGYHVESLAVITHIEDGTIYFKDEASQALER